jgi:type IV secretion system protein TrbI
MPDNPLGKAPSAPDSPDELGGGLRGRISGVTRVGPKALGAGIVLIVCLVAAVMWGMNRGAGPQATQAPSISAGATATTEPHFGADVPIVSTPEPTEAPIALPTNNPGEEAAHKPMTRQAQQTNVQPQTISDERKLRRELLDQALHSKIIANEGRPPSTPEALTKCVDASGQSPLDASKQQPAYGAASNSRDFLNGPLGQYSCLASAETTKDDYLASQRAVPRSSYEVLAGSIIPASLITAIDSELPGLVSGLVREDVYDTKTGKYLLIPRGSRLLGLYRSGAQYGQSRVLVGWTRLIFPDTTSIDLLGMSGADVEGNAGLAGTVDNHTGKILGAALLTSVLSAGLQLSQPQQQTIYPNAGQVAAGAAAQQILSVGSSMANKALGIAPTIHIPKGYPFSVIVDRDIVFPGTYQGI